MSRSPEQEEPKWLSASMLLAIHARQIERYGGAHGVLDENVVGSALAKPIHRRTYADEVDLADLAAAYLAGFSRSQGFRDGNKRTGLACALVFLALNGYGLHVPAGELYALCIRAATGEAEAQVVASYFRERMVPRS